MKNMKVVFNLFALYLLLFSGCKEKIIFEEYNLPENFSGYAMLIYHQDSAANESKETDNGKINIYNFSMTGIVKTKEPFYSGQIFSTEFYIMKNDGEKKQLDYSSEIYLDTIILIQNDAYCRANVRVTQISREKPFEISQESIERHLLMNSIEIDYLCY